MAGGYLAKWVQGRGFLYFGQLCFLIFGTMAFWQAGQAWVHPENVGGGPPVPSSITTT
ncbi:hypothetical protein HMI56_003842 [Coelomomyces lativittatus]|nr:hypothetical protein HMI56_003842 [Coelomomyces lativittatus]